MATANNTYRMGSRVLGLTIMALILMSCSFQPQTNSHQSEELPDIAIVNILNGIESDNYGVKMSCIYYAGKYKIKEVSQNLVEEIKSSGDDELCQMLVWSLYQIGNDSCCEELQTFVKNHSSEKLKVLCSYLQKIKEYETAVANN